MRIILSPLYCSQPKRWIHYASPALAWAAMTLGLAVPVQAKPAGDYLQPAGESIELTDLRTRHSKTFQHPNGTRTWSASQGSIHFQDERGSWQDIDTEILPLSAGPFAYGMTRNAYHSFFAADVAGPMAARFETAHWAVSFGVSGGKKGAVHLEGNQITYWDALPGADLRFTTREDELSEEIILHQRPATTEWEFELNLQGVRLETGQAGTLEFVDIRTGQRVWFMPKPFMCDAAGARSEAVTKQLVERRGKTCLLVKADGSWLADPARRYPVTVDPTFSRTTASQDACIRSGSPADNYDIAPLVVGYNANSTSLIRRSLVAWDMLGAPVQAQVANTANSVRVLLYEWDAINPSQPADIGCYPLNGTWSEGGVTWNTTPTFGTVLATVACTNHQWYTWQWNGNTAGIPLANQGVLFKNDSSESSADYSKAFDSKENNGRGTANSPKLYIDYTVSADRTWSGGSTTTDNWSDAANWGGTAPATSGDGVIFAGAVRTTPNMDNNYDVAKVQFSSGAGSFNIRASAGKMLTLSGDITQNSASLQTLNLPLALTATRTINAAAGDLIINGVISGLGFGLTKTGNYTVTLSGSSGNTFSGAATVNAGTLVLNKSSGNALGSVVPHVIGNGSGTATLQLDAADQIADPALVEIKSGGVLELSSGVTETIQGFVAGSPSAATAAGEVRLGANAQLTITPNLLVDYSAIKVTGTTGTKFIVNGSELIWTPQSLVNTFEKLVVGSNGRLRVGHTGNAWNGAETALGAVPSALLQDQITINGGTLVLSGGDLANKINLHANRGFTLLGNATLETWVDAVIPGKITGTGKLIHTGERDLELGGANDFSSGLSIGAGSVTLAAPSSAGSGPIAFSAGGTQLAVAAAGLVIPNPIDLSAVLDNEFGTNRCGAVNSFTLSGNVNLGINGAAPQINVPSAAVTITFNGQLSGTVGVSKTGPGRIVLGGANNYSGITTISAGTLTLGAHNTLPAGATVIIGSTGNGAIFDLGGCNQQVAALQTAGTAANQSIGNSSTTADSTLTFNSTGLSTFGGVIKDSIGSGTRKVAVKVDAGTLALTALNTYTGGTIVNNGTLQIGASGSIKGNVTVNSAGSLRTDTTSALESSATLTLAASPRAGTVNLNFTGTQTVNALNFGTTPKAAGTWGSLASSATYKDAAFTGDGLLKVTSVTLIEAPAIVTQPANQTACSGSTATFSVSAAGAGSLNYSWAKHNNLGWGSAWSSSGSGTTFRGSATENNSGGPACTSFTSASDINSPSGNALGLSGGSSGDAMATRAFPPLAAGQVVSIDMDNGTVDAGRVGFSLQQADGSEVFQFYFQNGQPNYKYNDGAEHDTGIGLQRTGLRVVFVLTSSSTYQLLVTPCGGTPSAFSGTCSGTIARLKLFNQNTSGGNDHNAYFNNFIVGGYVDNADNYAGGWAGQDQGDQPLALGNGSSSYTTPPLSSADHGAQYEVVVSSSSGAVLSSAATLTVNALPVGGADTLSTPKNTPCTMSAAKLKANDSGSGLHILAVTAGTGPDHGSVSLSGPDGTITYTPKLDYSGGDSFTYTLSNEQGCTAEVAASVTVGTGDGPSANVLYVGSADGAFVARFAGIPGYTYTVEYTDSLPPNRAWTKLGSDNYKAPLPSDPHPFGVGVFQVTDPMGSASRYYRTVWPAY